MIPVVSVVGVSNSGKTTFMEKLLRELTGRGYRVATIKHDVHGFTMDQPGKDTWRHARAGAKTVIISSPTKIAMVKEVEQEYNLDELLAFITDADLIVTEGYKRAGKLKIEVIRAAAGREPVASPAELIAVVSDLPRHELGLDDRVPVYHLNDAAGVAELLVRRFNLTTK